MPLSLILYKRFLDGLVGEPRKSPLVQIIKKVESNELPPDYHLPPSLSGLLGEMTTQQKRLLTNVLQEAHIQGMHAVLAYIAGQIDEHTMRISIDDEEISTKPFGSTIDDDWTRRCDGVEWP
jgi:hypothetical protein